MNNQIIVNKINNYFTHKYPERNNFWGQLFFRHGELERRRIVCKWIPSTRNISIIDVGCGDGKFLSSIISGYPKKITIEDISSFMVSEAYKNLYNRAEIVEKKVCNSLVIKSGNFDLILAIGIFDYYPNWEEAFKNLLLRSKHCIIASFPRVNNPRNWCRFIWFYILGIKLQLLNRKQLTNTFVSFGFPFEIERSRFEWFVRVTKNDRSK